MPVSRGLRCHLPQHPQAWVQDGGGVHGQSAALHNKHAICRFHELVSIRAEVELNRRFVGVLLEARQGCYRGRWHGCWLVCACGCGGVR